MTSHCIVHVGIYKTGTTAIQTMFKTNSSVFAQAGVLVDRQRYAAHGRVSRYIHDDKRKTRMRKLADETTPEAIAAYRKGFEDHLDARLAATENGGVGTCIFSDESLCAVQNQSEIERLAVLLKPRFDQITIVAYLRNQAEIAAAIYTQYLRGGGTRPSVLPERSKWDNQLNSYLNYEDLLNRWAVSFGEENVIPRIFSKDDLVGQDSCKDFLHTADLGDLPVVYPGRVNESINPTYQELLRLINLYMIGKQKSKEQLNFIRRFDKIDEFKGTGRKPARDEASAYLSVFEASNEAVRARWFPERKALFSIDLSMFPEKDTVSELTAEKTISAMSALGFGGLMLQDLQS